MNGPISQDEMFTRIIALLGEWWPDYCLIVRTPGGMNWRASDDTWAIGACKRFLEFRQAFDRPVKMEGPE